MANVLREHAAAYTVEGREDSGSLRDSAARPIYSAAHAHVWTQTATPMGLLPRAFNCTVNDETVSRERKKKRETGYQCAPHCKRSCSAVKL